MGFDAQSLFIVEVNEFLGPSSGVCVPRLISRFLDLE